MRYISVVLLLTAAGFGQAYSSNSLQNSPGNYSRAVPYAQVTLCVSSDTATPCTSKASTYTDDTLGTTCTTAAVSGVLTGSPVSGAGCNNPGIADANGNFTLYATPGEYRLCIYATTIQCQKINIAGTGVIGATVNCSVAINGSLAAFTSTTNVSCDALSGTDFAGGLFAQSYRALGANNGFVGLGGGLTDLVLNDANMVYISGADVVSAPYVMKVPGAIPVAGNVMQVLSVTGNRAYLQWTSAVGSVNSFSAGNLSPLFTTSVATSTTTPALTFALSNAAAHTFLGNTSGSSAAPSYSALPDLPIPCESGIGDGLNAIPAGTYPQTFCINKTGKTWTLTRIACYTDNNGTSTLNVTNGAGTALLTGAITCTNAIVGAAGTQSGTTTIADGDGMKFSFVGDGTTKQVTFVVNYTQVDQ